MLLATPTLYYRIVIDASDILYRDYIDISVAVATPKVDHVISFVSHMTRHPGHMITGSSCSSIKEC